MVFHPHQDVQHIKKENIGLIEVMGRAILPARLKSEIHRSLSRRWRFLLDMTIHPDAGQIPSGYCSLV